MPLSKQKKVEIQEALGEDLAKAGSLVMVNFHGLGVKETDAVRAALKEKGLSYRVAKKSLLRRVLAKLGVEGELPALEGEVAIGWCEDAVLPAKEAAVFAKKFKEKFRLLGGVLEGKFLNAKEVAVLAAVPPREVLLAQLLGVMQAPVRGLATVLAGVPRNLVVVLAQIKNGK